MEHVAVNKADEFWNELRSTCYSSFLMLRYMVAVPWGHMRGSSDASSLCPGEIDPSLWVKSIHSHFFPIRTSVQLVEKYFQTANQMTPDLQAR